MELLNILRAHAKSNEPLLLENRTYTLDSSWQQVHIDKKLVIRGGPFTKITYVGDRYCTLKLNRGIVDIQGIEIENIAIKTNGCEDVHISNNYFSGNYSDCSFNFGCKRVSINGNRVYRGKGARAFQLVKCEEGYVTNNDCYGNLKTGLNVSSTVNIDGFKSKGIYAANNVFVRDEGDGTEDHGIYIQTAQGVHLENNIIRGWSNLASGGSIKLRNSDDITIIKNTFEDSGLIIPQYGWIAAYPHLTNVHICDNHFKLESGLGGDLNAAMLLWRELGHDYPNQSERNINIWDNTINCTSSKIVNPVTLHGATLDKHEINLYNNRVISI